MNFSPLCMSFLGLSYIVAVQGREKFTLYFSTYPAVPVSAEYSPLLIFPGCKIISVEPNSPPFNFPPLMSRTISIPR